MKTVTYMSQNFEVPYWAKYIQATSTGMVFAYDKWPFDDDCCRMYVGCLEDRYWPVEKV